MRLAIPALAFVALCFASAPSHAQRSCSSFAVLKSYDAASQTLVVEYERGRLIQYFPKPEGTPRDSMKIPKPCRSKTKRQNKLKVSATGGRMTVTQIRSNFEPKMLNDIDDESWVPGELKKLIDSKTEVVIVLRPTEERDEPHDITTIYLPITDEEKAEIKRIEEQAEDV